ncbi:MAG: hypothetical protein LBU34_01145 [Planctomycetaceae bacterium]|nr:hypothetical protein [Planctomycetaceae bacterium]
MSAKKGRQPLAVAVVSALADSEFVQCCCFDCLSASGGGRKPFAETPPTFCWQTSVGCATVIHISLCTGLRFRVKTENE